MLAIALALLATASAAVVQPADDAGVRSMIEEESPEVFLAKATLQQYLSRIVRKDWDGTKRLTHPKAISAIDALQRRTGSATHNLAPWANKSDQLKTFSFTGARELAPGVVAIAVAEDVWHREEQGVSTGDPAVYLLFRTSSGTFLVGDKKGGAELADVSAESVRAGYPGWATAPGGVPQARHAATARR